MSRNITVPNNMKQRLYVIMGVAGSGKSSIGASVANRIGGTYIDGDDYHPPANIEKMSSGKPLDDDDRWPWLQIVAHELSKRSGIVLIGCSALKRAYRECITKHACEPVQFIYLDGSRDLIAERMAARSDHFMPTSLLDSQFATLQPPQRGENYIAIDISGTEDDVVASIVNAIS